MIEILWNSLMGKTKACILQMSVLDSMCVCVIVSRKYVDIKCCSYLRSNCSVSVAVDVSL
jgi:energy-converting hydrogenase Eha subunit C